MSVAAEPHVAEGGDHGAEILYRNLSPVLGHDDHRFDEFAGPAVLFTVVEEVILQRQHLRPRGRRPVALARLARAASPCGPAILWP